MHFPKYSYNGLKIVSVPLNHFPQPRQTYNRHSLSALWIHKQFTRSGIARDCPVMSCFVCVCVCACVRVCVCVCVRACLCECVYVYNKGLS